LEKLSVEMSFIDVKIVAKAPNFNGGSTYPQSPSNQAQQQFSGIQVSFLYTDVQQKGQHEMASKLQQ